MTTDLRWCEDDGRLVSAAYPIPDQPFDFIWPRGPVYGCNHLVCRECGEPVRNHAGYQWVTDDDAERTALYDDDWSLAAARGVVREDQTGRIYLCRCNTRVELGFREIADPTDYYSMDSIPPWRCGGHPLVSLPMVLDGLALGADSDVARLATDALAGSQPEVRPPLVRAYRAAWLQRVCHLLGPSSWTDSVAQAVADCLTHPNPAVRATAIDFFRHEYQGPGAERVAALSSEPALFVGVPNPLAPPDDLSQWLRVVVALRAELVDDEGRAVDQAARDALGRVATWSGPNPLSLLRALARLDPDWLLDHLGELLAAAATSLAAGDLLYVINGELPGRVAEAVAGMAASGVLPRSELEQLVSTQLQEPARSEALRVLGSDGPT